MKYRYVCDHCGVETNHKRGSFPWRRNTWWRRLLIRRKSSR